MGHPGTGNGIVAHDLESEMPVYPDAVPEPPAERQAFVPSRGIQSHISAVIFVMHYPLHTGDAEFECQPYASIAEEINR